jgi:hypothetical protein
MHFEGEGYVFQEYHSYRSGLLGELDYLWDVIRFPLYLWRRVRPFWGTVVCLKQAPASSPGSWYISTMIVRNWLGQKKEHYVKIQLFDVKPGDKVRRTFFRISVLRDKKFVHLKREEYCD